MLKLSKHREALNAQTSVARKIYDVVPAAEPWPVGQICGELKRTGSTYNHAVVTACLLALCDHGLVKKIGEKYQRVPVQAPATMPPPEIVRLPTVKQNEDTARGADRVGLMTARIRTIARQLGEVADEIDSAAVELLDDMQSTTEQTKRLQQLRDLLKEL